MAAKRTRNRSHKFNPSQRYLFQCLGQAFLHARDNVPLTHLDFLRVIEAYREAFTENWIESDPKLDGGKMSKFLGKR